MIDNLPSQVLVHKLLKKQNRSKEQDEQIILANKKGAYDMTDLSFSLTYNLAKKKSNTSDQRFINLQQLILNATKLKIPVTSIKKYLQQFSKQIGRTPYLQKLAALLTFSFDKENIREDLQNIIKEDLSDLDSRKRILTSYKRQGRLDDYIKKLNAFLEENPSDTQAWIELSQLYTERGLYLRALFCLEQIVVIHPENDHYMVKLAELYVTLGGKQNVKHAIKYYSHVISRCPKNARALWGLYRVLHSMGDKIDGDHIQLKQLCFDTINNQYSKKNPKIKLHIAF